MLDVERRVAGTGSPGWRAGVVLVQGEGGDSGQRLLTWKQAVPVAGYAAAGVHGVAQPVWPDAATRIVTLQQRLQAVPMVWLHAVRLATCPAKLREL